MIRRTTRDTNKRKTKNEKVQVCTTEIDNLAVVIATATSELGEATISIIEMQNMEIFQLLN